MTLEKKSSAMGLLMLSSGVELNPSPEHDLLKAINSATESLNAEIHDNRADVMHVKESVDNVRKTCTEIMQRVDNIVKKQKGYNDKLRQIEEAINSATCTESPKAEIHDVRGDIMYVKESVDNVRETCTEIMQRVKYIEKKQKRYDDKLRQTEEELDHIRGDRDMFKCDIDAVQQINEQNSENLCVMEDMVDKLERETIKCNMRVFGLQEQETDGESLINLVVNNVLKVASPNDDWSSDYVSHAFRVGVRKGTTPRVVVVQFEPFKLKRKVVQGRINLRAKGIKVSNDFTTRQRAKLSELKANGEIVYFYRGELRVRETSNRNPTEGARRTCATAARRVTITKPQAPNTHRGRPINSE